MREIVAALCTIALASALLTTAAVALPPAKQGPSSSWVCQDCHGTAGEGNARANLPRLAGQEPDYLKKQLLEYKSGARENPIMQEFAKSLNDADRVQLAQYFSKLKALYDRSQTTVNVGQIERGHQRVREGAETIRVQACDNCHGPGGSVEFSAPYLAGQPTYLVTRLTAWRHDTRKNDSGQVIASVAKHLSDSDFAAVATYFSSLEGPL